MKKIVLILLVTITSFGLKSQVKLDSLFSIWEDVSKHDTIRAQAMDKYIWEGYFYTKPDSAIILTDQLFEFNQGIDYKIGMVKNLLLLGYTYFRIGNYPMALKSYQNGLEISEEIDYKQGIADNLLRTGFLYHDNEDVITALHYYERSLEIFQETEDLWGVSAVYNEFGSIYRETGDFDKSLDYFLKSIAINEELNDELGNASMFINIGKLYLAAEDYPKALEYNRRALGLYEQLDDKLGIAASYAGIGIVYSQQGNNIAALEQLHKSLLINDEVDHSLGISTNLLDIADIYIAQGRYAEAANYCSRSYDLAKVLGDIGNQESSCECLYLSYKALGRMDEAMRQLEQKLVFTDSLHTEKTAMRIQQMEFRNQLLADSLIQEEKNVKIEMAHQEEVRAKDKNRNLAIGAGIFFLFLAGGFYSRWRYVKKSKATIEREKDRSEELLLNILPHEIAEELKETGEAAARDFELVSILFTDFKGFTEKAEKLSASELIEEINHCFKAFDHICDKYGIEKIKTIGDAYMAAGGIPAHSDDAAKNTILAGLEMQSFVADRFQERQANNEIAFEMRLGIHSGPVVAGIVGVKKFQYDIWGDTVNTASRIESNGQIGKVNISQDTYELVQNDPDFAFESRGKIQVKGKGDIEMWFVKEA